jgi:hypothetical protein
VLPFTALKGTQSIRSRVDEIMAQLRQGINPNEADRQRREAQRKEREADEVAGITFEQAFNKAIEIKPVRARTLTGYQAVVDEELAIWKDKPLREIDGKMALARWAEIDKEDGNVQRAM